MHSAHRLLALVLALSWLPVSAGCRATKTGITPSGFLGDYGNLEREPDGALMYRAPGLDLSRYDRILLEPVQLFAGLDSTFRDLEGDELDLLQESFWNTIYNALEPDYQVVEDPGPGVLRVRVAITGARKVRDILPIRKSVGDTYMLIGVLDMEAELLDSQSGERLAAIVDSQSRSSKVTSFGEADEVFGTWARRFRARLDADRARSAGAPR